jgi:SAM-dependent methyltransferase
MAAAGPEIARVLAPGGILAGLWNVYDDRIDWVAGFDRISEGAAGVTLSDWQGQEGDAHLAAIDMPELFGPAERAEFRHGQQRTADSLLATIATHSELLVMPDDARADLLVRIRAYLDSHQQTGGGEFTLPLLTGVLRARRL